LHLNRIPTKVLRLVSILALAIAAIGLDAATSYGGSSAKGRRSESAGATAREHKSTSTSCLANGKSKSARKHHKHAVTAKRCNKKTTSSSGTPATQEDTVTGSGSSAGPNSSPVGAESEVGLVAPESATSSESSLPSGAPPATTSGEPFRFFAATSPWNEAVSTGAARDPSSGSIMGQLMEEIAHGKETGEAPQTTIDTTSWSVPVYTVPAGQATVKVTLNTPKPNPALQRAFEAVPLPADAKPAVGTDALLVVWQPSTGKLWEFWQLAHGSEGWTASYGGAMQNVSSSTGVFGPEAWPGATTEWGASSCSMSMVGGLISLEDLESGKINHALMLAIPHVRAGVYSSPAKRTDGKYENALDLPEGAHLRLPPSLDIAALHLPKLDLWIAEAAQRYGIYVCLGGVNVGFFGQDPTPTGTDPYTGPDGYFEGKPANKVIEQFPWKDLELLKMELHSM
jgi:hypothetical protein